ncbi:BQ2448_6080 [Microbotryum intermedium]|uniref:BQ2448_6080 protein n=1 Tax=Microbotryum intermedium TaxID=269621 RepID=A0A238FIN4_9BASI|nr:BQ2448_6080 [Microbotryum intermedium]
MLLHVRTSGASRRSWRLAAVNQAACCYRAQDGKCELTIVSCIAHRTPTVLDYHSDCPTFSLAFSPLGTTTSSLKLAVGSYNESRAQSSSTTPFSSANSSSGATTSSFEDINNLTIISLDPAYLDLEDVHPNHFDSSPSPHGGSTSGSNHSEYTSSSVEGYVRSRNGHLLPSQSAFLATARAPMPYPPSAIAFSPANLSNQLQSSSLGTKGETTREMIASSSECLRLWDLVASDEMVGGNAQGGQGSGSAGFVGALGRRASAGPQTRLVERARLANSKQEYSAPLTSFSWSTLEPTHIVTSSIDTTCTVWDISTRVPVTQLIAHDREVYDVAWSPASRDVFASVGADGSVRMFDLRSLEHSTILYEATSPSPSTSSSTTHNKNGGGGTSSNQSHGSPNPGSKTPLPPSPLLRLAFSPTSPTYLSIVHADSTHVQILDTRSPGVPVMEVRGHAASVNGMAWGGSTLHSASGGGGGGGGGGDSAGPGWLATCSDDSTLLLWDLSSSRSPNPSSSTRSSSTNSSSTGSGPKMITTPSLSYSAPGEINAVAWGGGGEWVAAGCGKTVRCLKV